jgi:catechol 2,3-dioxygenase-like lactoylglutathione lyase family enzyme
VVIALDAALATTRREDLKHGTNAAYVAGLVSARSVGKPARKDGQERRLTRSEQSTLRETEAPGWRPGDLARYCDPTHVGCGYQLPTMLSMALWIRLDHTIVGVSNWEISNRFYRDVVGAEIAPHGKPPRVAYRLGDTQLNVHGPGLDLSTNVARLPVQPGNSDLCFRWPGPIEDAIAHLAQHSVEVETGPVARLGAKGQGISVYFRDPDGSLLEFISYDSRR